MRAELVRVLVNRHVLRCRGSRDTIEPVSVARSEPEEAGRAQASKVTRTLRNAFLHFLHRKIISIVLESGWSDRSASARGQAGGEQGGDDQSRREGEDERGWKGGLQGRQLQLARLRPELGRDARHSGHWTVGSGTHARVSGGTGQAASATRGPTHVEPLGAAGSSDGDLGVEDVLAGRSRKGAPMASASRSSKGEQKACRTTHHMLSGRARKTRGWGRAEAREGRGRGSGRRRRRPGAWASSTAAQHPSCRPPLPSSPARHP